MSASDWVDLTYKVAIVVGFVGFIVLSDKFVARKQFTALQENVKDLDKDLALLTQEVRTEAKHVREQFGEIRESLRLMADRLNQ